MFKKRFDQSDRYWISMRSPLYQRVKILDELMEMTRATSQRLASLEYDARQPRLAMEADGQADTKTRERTEGAATAVQAMHGDSYSVNRVDPDPICSTSFGDDCIEPPVLPCSWKDALVDNGAAAPNSCLPPLEMRSPTAASGVLPTGEASIATRTTFNQPLLRLYSTEETNSKKTSIQYQCCRTTPIYHLENAYIFAGPTLPVIAVATSEVGPAVVLFVEEVCQVLRFETNSVPRYQ